MKFKIIPNEQTPKVEIHYNSKGLIESKYNMLVKFMSFARRQHDCAGLAANQVSCDGKRIMEWFFVIFNKNHWDIIINPVIFEYIGKKEIKEEGCLSWLGKKIRAERHSKICVCYYTLKGEYIEKAIEGLEAQVWQHEYDHLMGIKEIVLRRGVENE